jgi:SAM-dependent methyltransferase
VTTQADRARTRDFFGPRAAGWEDRFPDDGPAYARAVGELGPRPGAVVLDAACGTGRALPALRAAVGPVGRVLAADLTPQMLHEARRLGRHRIAQLLEADVLALPLAAGCVDAVLAAGLLSHLPDPAAGLAELARVCRPGARLALFHPLGRAALARRHGRELDPDDVRAEGTVRRLLDATGWRCTAVDDAADRWLVLAERS